MSKTIAFFPEAAYGPALNSVGIAQACQTLGYRCVFLTDPGMSGLYSGYGFEEYPVNMSAPMPADEMARYWSDFINSHLPNFRKSPIEQLDNYIKECWAAIVETSQWAQKELPALLKQLKPDLICVDNVILFPAIKQYSKAQGKPWVRIISCSENEIEDPDIPPHLSGMAQDDKDGHARFRAAFHQAIKEVHAGFNDFLIRCGERPYPLGTFFEDSPWMNLLLYPDPVRFNRRHPLDSGRFHYLQGCVRKEAPYAIPKFPVNHDKPLIYVSFGSLGCGDTDLIKRLIQVLSSLPYRVLVNVGDYLDAYSQLPNNVLIDQWFPQPSVIAQADLVIHHGGNNSFTECLYFGKPAIIMPYAWDGHDNAMRVQETGHGLRLDRYDWTASQLAANIAHCCTDAKIRQRLQQTSHHMQARPGPLEAAHILDKILQNTEKENHENARY
ncbi:glycosyl transferase family 1 [Ventosimonas gracilis]|uniref:Glycosyl transferase family 1 n=1 Tax=Ventosimonas gracilis TaxID=1680762 RepID=A0A139SXA4_9GAMM|nr:glycosyltransferase [Ventosimonas gracilis]KXU39209.1 glycosyl transferase family 1 [Ventosimonas gracilis]